MTFPFLKSIPGQDPVVVENTFNTTAARLFRAWITPSEIIQWFGPGPTQLASAHVDPRNGGTWEFAYADNNGIQDILSGEYVLVAQNEQLVFTWQHERRKVDGDSEKTPTSLVTVTFEDVEGGARLHLTHERIVKEGGRLGVGEGWSKCFTNLERVIED